MFKICVIGCGGMANGGHGPAFKKYKEDYKDICLAACCDVDENKAKKYKEDFGFKKYYSNYEQMLEIEKPDVVSLIVPVHLTKSIAIDIMKKGFNIILEKPPGKDVDEIKEMIAQAEKSNVNVRVAFNRRYAPLLIKLKELIKESREEITNITYQMYRHNRRESDFSTTAIHAIDTVKYIAEADYKKVDLSFQNRFDIGENVKNVYLECELEKNIHAHIDLVPLSGVQVERISLNTQNHTYFVHLPIQGCFDQPGELVHFKQKQLVEKIDGASLVDSKEYFEGAGFYNENRLFFEHIRNNNEITCDLASAIQSVELEDCVRKSVNKYI